MSSIRIYCAVILNALFALSVVLTPAQTGKSRTRDAARHAGAALSHKTKLGREVDLPKQLRRLAAAPATSGPVGSQSARTIPSRTAGEILGTHKVGKGPFGVAAQGEFVFVSNFFGKSLTKLRASDGSILGTFKIGDGAAGVAADENGLWEFFVFDGCELRSA